MDVHLTVIALVISGLSLALSAYLGFGGRKRDQQADTAAETTTLTTLLVRLEHISAGITEIKTQISSLQTDTRELRERITRVEESVRQAHRRLDETGKQKREGTV